MGATPPQPTLYIYSVQDSDSLFSNPRPPSKSDLAEFERQLRLQYGTGFNSPKLLRQLGMPNMDYQKDDRGCPLLEFSSPSGASPINLVSNLESIAEKLNIRIAKLESHPAV